MNIALINPPQPLKDLKSLFSKGGYILPYNLLCLGSFLKQKGLKVKIIDCVAEGITLDELRTTIKKEKYDVVGLSGFTFTIPRVYATATLIKSESPETIVVVGGVHASAIPVQTLEECEDIDYIIAGEGEETLYQLIDNIQNKKSVQSIRNLAYRDNNRILFNKTNDSCADLSALPVPDYSLLNMDLYVPHSGNYRVLPTYSFYASRGCPFSCAFCSVKITLGKRVRYKNLDRAIEEISILKRDYNVRGLIFQDSTFTINKNWVWEFCERLIEEGFNLTWRANTRADCIDIETLKIMKAAGCHRVNVGFESANQETLDLLQKGTTVEQNRQAALLVKKAGLELGASFIIGLPNEGLNEVMNTINFAKQIGDRYTNFYLPVPYPGTELRELCKDGTRAAAKWSDYSSRDFSNAVYLNKNFSKEFFIKLSDYAYHKYYYNLYMIVKMLYFSKSIVELKDTLHIIKNIFMKWRKI